MKIKKEIYVFIPAAFMVSILVVCSFRVMQADVDIIITSALVFLGIAVWIGFLSATRDCLYKELGDGCQVIFLLSVAFTLVLEWQLEGVVIQGSGIAGFIWGKLIGIMVRLVFLRGVIQDS